MPLIADDKLPTAPLSSQSCAVPSEDEVQPYVTLGVHEMWPPLGTVQCTAEQDAEGGPPSGKLC